MLKIYDLCAKRHATAVTSLEEDLKLSNMATLRKPYIREMRIYTMEKDCNYHQGTLL